MTRIIDQSHLFKSLDPSGRESVLACGYVTTLPDGAVLIREGDAGDSMFLVMNGRVRVETQSASGRVHLAELGRGACVGEVSVLSGQPRTATVTAVGDVDAVAFAKHRIERVLAEYPKVREVLEKLVHHRARDTIEKILG